MIRGKRVVLRAIEEQDLDLLLEWLNDPFISQQVTGFSFPLSRPQQRRWFERSLDDASTQRWMVLDEGGRPIGVTGLWAIDRQNRHALSALKLGAADLRGKGYGTDAIMTVFAYAFFQVGLNRVWGEILPYNVASYRAYVEKCGCKVEGVLRQHTFRDGRFHDQVRVAILREDFEALPAAKDYLPASVAARVRIEAHQWGHDRATFEGPGSA